LNPRRLRCPIQHRLQRHEPLGTMWPVD
jgi:hypothetical protein